jgi:uncharacterized repeat protein (TIGR03803 family)
MTLSSAGAAMVQLVAVMAAVPLISAQELTYQEIATLNVNLEPSPDHFDRGDGYLYGACRDKLGGNGGMIYRLAPGQPVEVLHSFQSVNTIPTENDGGAGLALFKAEGPDGALYGTTETGGPEGYGVLFRYDVHGNFSILDSSKVGGMPIPNDLVVTADGDIYGVSDSSDGNTGGANNWGGCLFRRAADGSISILHVFNRPPFVPSTNPPGFRPRPPVTPPAPGPFVAPYYPLSICDGPDGKLYGVSSAGGFGRGTFFSFDLATGALDVLADFSHYNDFPRRMIPAEGGFHVLLERRLLHIGYDGTVEMEVDGTLLPYYQTGGADFRGVLETDDGVYVESAYGGAHNAGYVARYRSGEGAAVVYHYPLAAREKQRVITAGPDGKIHGVIGYPEGYVPPVTAAEGASSVNAQRNPVTERAAAKKKPVSANPKSFRFRKAGDSGNFMPLAEGDTAWLPAKASKSGSREVTLDLLANDGDPDRHPLSVISVTTEGTASASLIETNLGPRLRVVTTEGNPASQRVIYQLSDGNGGTSTGNVAIFSPITAAFSGPILPAVTGHPAGTITVKISGRNAVSATVTLAGKKLTGRGVLDVDDTTDIQLKGRGQNPIALRADLVRSGAQARLDVFLPFGGTVYSATLSAQASGAGR